VLAGVVVEATKNTLTEIVRNNWDNKEKGSQIRLVLKQLIFETKG